MNNRSNRPSPYEYLEPVPVTDKNCETFFALLEEQAQLLEPTNPPQKLDQATRARLLEDVQRGELCQAFMLFNKEICEHVTAVTYYDFWSPLGHALYLEDIITAQSQRKQGCGRYAMGVMAHRASLTGKVHEIHWECASQNHNGHSFYDSLGAERHDERITLRHADPAALPSSGVRLSYFDGLKRLPHTPRNRFNLERRHVFSVCGHNDMGLINSFAAFSRSYSTFRATPGLHLSEFFGSSKRADEQLGGKEAVVSFNPEAVLGLVCAVGHTFGPLWGGHMDITVRRNGNDELHSGLKDLGFAPLTYGTDTMIPRNLDLTHIGKLAVIHWHKGKLPEPQRGVLKVPVAHPSHAY